MKVRMLVTLSGTRNGKEWPTAGNTMELPDAEAAQLCESQLAIPYRDVAGGVEAATASTVDVELRSQPAANERALTTKTGPGPGRKATR